MTLPSGAKEILDARKRGFKPADLVLVSLIGKLQEENPIVYANTDAEYDWRWCVGLKLCIFIKPKTDWKKTTMAIAMQRPEWLAIYDVDRFVGSDVCALPTVESIELPKARWRWELSFIPWLKFENEAFSWN